MAENTTTVSDITKTLKDAAYVAVGFGVLAFQKAQVQRRELEKQLTKAAAELEERSKPVVEAVESSLDQIEGRLPEQAREVFKQARTTAKEAGEQLRSRLAPTNSASTKAAA
jgi:ElaB/YqjD/DUF883 family membrane-anchored ribosome-binding protein